MAKLPSRDCDGGKYFPIMGNMSTPIWGTLETHHVPAAFDRFHHLWFMGAGITGEMAEKMRKSIAVALVAIALPSGCVSTPKTPMEAYLNRWAGAEAAALNCPAYGGYGSVQAMRADAEKNLARAKELGATQNDIDKARQNVNGTLGGAIIMVGPIQACNAFIGNLAWLGTSTPQLPNKPAAPATSTLPARSKTPAAATATAKPSGFKVCRTVRGDFQVPAAQPCSSGW